ETVETLPEGMRYREQLIAPAEEKALIARVRELPFKEFELHGHKGKRRTVSFGWQYEFAGRGALKKANDIPEFILPLRAIAAMFGRQSMTFSIKTSAAVSDIYLAPTFELRFSLLSLTFPGWPPRASTHSHLV